MSFRELCENFFLGSRTFNVLFSIVFSLIQNGEIFLFTGMLDTVLDLHQLAVIIGHEMAHAVLGHSVSAALPANLCCASTQQYQSDDNALRQQLCKFNSVPRKYNLTLDVQQS